MTSDIFFEVGGRRVFLKWHRGRRRLSDPVFTGRRILEGMALGASVEVDLVVHGGQGFAVLHDLELGGETTGHGAVADKSAEELRREHILDNRGTPTDEPVLLLEDLCALLGKGGLHPDALLQLDYKQDLAALDPATVGRFAESVGPVASHMILSAGDADAVKLLADATPGLHVGYDPCYGESLRRLREDHDFSRFVRDALQTSPDAEMIYLSVHLVAAADDHGFNMISAFQDAGKRVDTWTIQKVDADSLKLVERLIRLGADQITTDDPEGLGAALSERRLA